MKFGSSTSSSKDVKTQLERIRLRVAKGGHNVPMEKVKSRRSRSIVQMLWFIEYADEFWIFDNTGAENALVGQGNRDGRSISRKAPLDLVRAIVLGFHDGLSGDQVLDHLTAELAP